MKHAEHEVYEVVVGQLFPGAVLDQYVVKNCIGSGGMALVYEAEDTVLRRPVAIKMLSMLWSADTSVRARFLREARAAATLRHPNVVAVFEVGRYRETPYLVMERLQGETLAKLLEREGALSMRKTADLMIPVLSAIAAAHALGIVHRDLKPENLYLSRAENGTITPKVLDFGISKMLLPSQDSDVTRSDVLLGTPNYMSPEHVQSNDLIDARSDIFSLGVVMYECITGQKPFKASSLHLTLEAILSASPPRPDAVKEHVDSVFSDIVLRALHKSREQRYTDARALGADLLPYASKRVRVMFEQDFLSDRGSRPALAVTDPPHRLPSSGKPARSLRYLMALSLITIPAGFAAWLSWSTPRPSAAPPPARSTQSEALNSAEALNSVGPTQATAALAAWPAPLSAPEPALSARSPQARVPLASPPSRPPPPTAVKGLVPLGKAAGANP